MARDEEMRLAYEEWREQRTSARPLIEAGLPTDTYGFADATARAFRAGAVWALRRAETYMEHRIGCPRAERSRAWTLAEVSRFTDTNEMPPCECGLDAISALTRLGESPEREGE